MATQEIYCKGLFKTKPLIISRTSAWARRRVGLDTSTGSCYFLLFYDFLSASVLLAAPRIQHLQSVPHRRSQPTMDVEFSLFQEGLPAFVLIASFHRNAGGCCTLSLPKVARKISSWRDAIFTSRNLGHKQFKSKQSLQRTNIKIVTRSKDL